MRSRYPLKPVLDIRQKTYEQRKHLETLVRSRGLVNCQTPWQSSRPMNPSTSKFSQLRKVQIQNENRILLNKLANITQSSTRQPANKFTMLSQNLSETVALNRQRKYRDINKENKSLYQRIMSTSPCMLKKKQWQKVMESQTRYRQNAMRKGMIAATVAKSPDYTTLAESQLNKSNISLATDLRQSRRRKLKPLESHHSSGNITSKIR